MLNLASVFEGMLEYHEACATVPFDGAACENAILKYLAALGNLHDLWTAGLGADLAARQGWHMRPKAHLMEHLALDKIEIFGSPSTFNCYQDENFVGKVKKIAAKSRHPWTLSNLVLKKLGVLARLDALGV